MDVRYISPFLEGTVNVLKTMAFVEPKPGEPFAKKDRIASGDISGIIGLTGVVNGSLVLSFSERCITRIVSNMLGEEITEMNGDIQDAVGEITNMVSGVARKKLEIMGISLQSASPTVVTGKNHSICHVMDGPSIVIPFEIDAGPFAVEVCMG
ncbi:MAG: chemotaxis protein CheX [Syntrophobacterales bacterium]|nr:MAG: chemotaxis protein CheX [Syntrophobacterales bacterium]